MALEELLTNVPLFRSLDDDDLQVLAGQLELRNVDRGTAVFREGETGPNSLFIIEDGSVEISRSTARGTVELATLYAGQYFGELSLIDGSPRSATATAAKDSRLMVLHRDDFVDFLHKDPAAALLIMGELAARLRNTNELMAQQVSRNVNEEMDEKLTFGQRVADRVAAFGGSWPFIFVFGGIMVVWIGINATNLFRFDPFPFILLNLVLSTIAALQAPVIMMSQNRQSTKDKLLAENDFRVNLKSEMEISQVLRLQTEALARLQEIETRMGRAGGGTAPAH
ncbi:MAG: DUF1003 domain-containing protein [Acidobacteriota bacterium]